MSKLNDLVKDIYAPSEPPRPLTLEDFEKTLKAMYEAEFEPRPPRFVFSLSFYEREIKPDPEAFWRKVRMIV